MRLALLLSLFATPAFAGCEDWWFTRNLIMDRAGYCFGSVLGQAQFDNAGCIGKSVDLDAASAQLVTTIRTYEKEFQCRVNTAQPRLDVPDADIRRTLDALPVADGFESACISYVHRAPLTLTSAPWSGARVIGQISFGDNIGFGHIPQNGWTYVTAHDAQWGLRSAGWLNGTLATADCANWAG